MDYILNTLENLWNQTAFTSLDWKNYIMILVALLFLYLAIKKGFDGTIREEEESKYTSKDVQKVYQSVIKEIAKRYEDLEKH